MLSTGADREQRAMSGDSGVVITFGFASTRLLKKQRKRGAVPMQGSLYTPAQCAIKLFYAVLCAHSLVTSAVYCGRRTVNTPGIREGSRASGAKLTAFGLDICGWLEAEQLANVAGGVHGRGNGSTQHPTPLDLAAWLPNVIFVKGMKVGGTTAASVMHQIGRNYGMVNLFVADKWGMTAAQIKGCYSANGAALCCPDWNGGRLSKWLTAHRQAVAHVLDASETPWWADGAPVPPPRPAAFRYFLGIQDSMKGLRKSYRPFLQPARAPRPTFLWAMARNPQARALSYFMHKELPKLHAGMQKAGMQNKSSDFLDDNAIRVALTSPELHNGMVTRCSGAAHPGQASADAVMSAMDFVGVTERFEESMLVLKHKLNLSLADVLFMRVKVSAEGRRDNTGKVPVPNKPLRLWSDRVKAVLGGQAFAHRSSEDFKLWRSANTSLNQAIDAIGARVFSSELAKYRNHLAQVSIKCSPPPSVSFEQLCCLYRDAGCGYLCIEEYSATHALVGAGATRDATEAPAGASATVATPYGRPAASSDSGASDPLPAQSDAATTSPRPKQGKEATKAATLSGSSAGAGG